ncbi:MULTISPECIES: hypothetical protein [Thermomonospora]|uniref:Uncharacterized protein n=1 Tax=Thermomonospora curvata (strain ATCC 19995 / DSM 43183 / JCM 3096 / KCTC 9072 / NBRC 15933 / NCIMB 10081 / Henssen B9) TaxID=471852 RepID=D1A7G6_THECD|nr:MULTISPECIES: hypothetical protein [Thermomonospora]ACY96555.1 hypothetical protein Tcur_0969 [Thermomonospora curvata DSM 43183]PKK15368.1 MAG: hypothetical protein BUE48_004695 [Thermomonospora sp. CIF 1]
MPHVPPIVHSRTANGPAYLLAWIRSPEGAWEADIAWLEVEGESRQGRTAHVPAEDITKIDGQDYSRVPRRAGKGRGGETVRPETAEDQRP